MNLRAVKLNQAIPLPLEAWATMLSVDAMDAETTEAKMMEQVGRAQQSAMARELGWGCEVAGLNPYVTLRPRKRSDATFLLRVAFDDFPRKAPSYVFVDIGTKETTEAAWPPNVRHGAQPPGICTPGTREFHENFHANDQGYPWDPDRFTVLDTVARIHQLMEHGVG